MAELTGMFLIPASLNPDGIEIRVDGTKENALFCLPDLAKVMGIEDARVVARRIGKDDRCQIPVIDAIGRKQRTWFVTESGLWDVVLQSKKPEARAIRRLITRDVMPCLYRFGMYTEELARQLHAGTVPPTLPGPCVPPPPTDALTALVAQMAELCQQVAQVACGQRIKLRPVREYIRCVYWPDCPAEYLKEIVNDFAQEFWRLFEHHPPHLGKQIACGEQHLVFLEPVINQHYEAWQEEKRQRGLPFPVPEHTPAQGPPPAAPQLECPHPTQIIIVNPPPSV